MRIVHVVTYISADGAFGGPVAVAVAQAKELARRGHTVELIAGWDGKAKVELPGVSVRLFPVRRLPVGGFSGLFSISLLWHIVRAGDYDVFHVHLARDLITLPSARLAQLCHRVLVVQPHGMLRPDRRLRARVLDMVATRPVLRTARVALALTPMEQDGLTAIASGRVRVAPLVNGIASDAVETSPRGSLEPEVLFLARLHPGKRVMTFAEMARDLVRGGVCARFSVVGPDQGDLARLTEFIKKEGLGSRLTYEGALAPEDARRRYASAAVYVLPSLAESFGMTVLEAMAAAVPVVITDGCAIAGVLGERRAALVTDGSVHELVEAVSTLLEDSTLRSSLVANACRTVEEVFSIRAVGEMLLEHYAESDDTSPDLDDSASN